MSTERRRPSSSPPHRMRCASPRPWVRLPSTDMGTQAYRNGGFEQALRCCGAMRICDLRKSGERIMKKLAAVLLMLFCISGTAIAVKRIRWENAMAQAEDPLRPVMVDGVEHAQSEFAVVEVTAPDFSAWIHAVDKKKMGGFNEITPQTLFLSPGEHTFDLMFENHGPLSVGRAYGTVAANLLPGHVYMPRGTVVPDGDNGRRGKLRLELLDYGPQFPRPCLTSLIAKHRQMGAVTFEMRKSAYRECILAQGYRDRHLDQP